MRKTDVWKIGKKTIVAIIVFAMVFSVFVGMNALNGKAEVFGANVEVSDYGYKPDIALSSTGTIYAAFEKTNVEFSKSIDNGTTFSTPILVTPSETNWQYTPAIAAYGENDVYVVWEQDYKIYYARSTTGGDSFETKVQVSDVGGSGIYNDVPDIAVDSNGVIYVVWAYDTGTDYTISIDKSTDGATFGTDVRVDDDTVTVVSNPSIAIDSANNILVTYEGNDHVYYTKSIDGGAHFSASVRVDDSTSYTADSSMGVGADGKIFVALQYGGDIYVAMSSDGGATFGTDVKVNDDTTDKGQYLPSLAVHPCGKVFVAWKDGRSGAKEIYFANSTDGGATFNTNIKVTDQPPAATYDHGYPSLAVGDDTEVYIAWQDKRSGVEYTAIYFSQAPDATWPSTVDTLAVVGATGDSITINWTAPGDNFALGTATTYDIRYSTSDITTDAEWDAATLVTDEPAPKAGGDDETFIVTGLGNDTTYYFALKTADEIPIWSLTISNVASGKTLDDWAPDAVIDLTAINPTSSGITLTWTAPGDNGTLGTAAEYVIRYSNATINETNWVSATNCTGEPTPQEAGNTETFIVTGLVMNTTYYFALKTVDDATPTPLWSPLSNVATNKTTTNTPPVASNLVITPTAPKTTDNLVRSYVYSDVETDAESGTEIRWYKDDVLQTAYNDALTIPSTATAKDQVWYFTVKPNDGIEFGVLVTSASVTILNSVPVANFTVSPAAPYYRDAVITFNASVSTDPDAVDIVNYTWNVSGEIKYGLEVDYTFTTLGTFNVILTVKDASDVVNSTTLQVTIVNQAPTASFTVSATEVKVGVEIEFTSTSTDPESDTLTYLWTFGDGETSTEANPKHTYDSAGTYEVTLKVTDAYDAEHTSTATTITIKAATITEPTTGAIITAQYTGTGNVSAASASSPGAAPSGKVGIGKFVEVTAPTTLTITWVYIKVPYTAADIPAGGNESSLKMYYWTGSEWAVCNNTGVDTVNKFVWANVTHLTIFAPMAESAAVTPTTPVNWALYGGVVAVIAIVIIAAAAVVITKKKKGKGETPAETEE